MPPNPSRDCVKTLLLFSGAFHGASASKYESRLSHHIILRGNNRQVTFFKGKGFKRQSPKGNGIRFSGGRGQNRTGMRLPSAVFETAASTVSATRPESLHYLSYLP